jgi:hypothetical protein
MKTPPVICPGFTEDLKIDFDLDPAKPEPTSYFSSWLAEKGSWKPLDIVHALRVSLS